MDTNQQASDTKRPDMKQGERIHDIVEKNPHKGDMHNYETHEHHSNIEQFLDMDSPNKGVSDSNK